MLLWQHVRFQSPASLKLNITISNSTRQNTWCYLTRMPVPRSIVSPLWHLFCIFCPMQLQMVLLYSWCFSRYSGPINWLVHSHMTSNNKTVSRQMPWADNIAKTMMQFTVSREMLTNVARDRWNLSAVFKCCFCFVLLYNKSLNDRSLGEQWILFPSTSSRETNFTVPLGTSH